MSAFITLAEAVPNPVVTAITEAATNVKTDAGSIIAAAVGVGIVFWGAKVLWSKFKSMAK